MFCPSCGAPNPDAAKFCNQCGERLGPSTEQGAGSPVGSPAAPRAGAAGQGTLTGMSTHDLAASMVTGPSRRQLVVGAVAIASLGVAVGVGVTWRSRQVANPPPVTSLGPVGLVAEPAAVTGPQTVETDAGTVIEVASAPSSRRGRRAPAQPSTPVAGPSPSPPPPRPSTASAERARANPAEATAAPSGNTITRDREGNVVVSDPDGQPLARLDRTRPAAGAPGADAAAAALPAPAEDGVVERGPRSSRGGFREGEETDATGTMDPQAFRFVYRHYQSQIASCWSSVSRGTTVSGVMVVRVRIAEADGRVSRTRVVSDSTGNAALQACVQNNIRTWRYPRPEGGDVEVDYPLRFGGAS